MQSLSGAVVCLILSLPAIASAQDAPDETSAIGLSLSYVAGITAVVDGGPSGSTRARPVCVFCQPPLPRAFGFRRNVACLR